VGHPEHNEPYFIRKRRDDDEHAPDDGYPPKRTFPELAAERHQLGVEHGAEDPLDESAADESKQEEVAAHGADAAKEGKLPQGNERRALYDPDDRRYRGEHRGKEKSFDKTSENIEIPRMLDNDRDSVTRYEKICDDDTCHQNPRLKRF